jgi:ankyrin repeat protein
VIENPTNDPFGDSLLEELTENNGNNHGNLILAPIIVCEENPNSVNTNSRHTYIHLQASTSWAEKTKSLIPEILAGIIDQQPCLSGFLTDIQAALEKCQSSLQFWFTIWSLREQLRSPQLNRISFGSKVQYLPDNTLFAAIKIYYSLPVWAKKALSWVLHARRPLKVKELAAALLIDRIDQKKIILPTKDCVFLDLPIELERVSGSFLKSENDEISVAREGLAPLLRKIVSSDTRASTCSSEFNKITSKPDEIPNDWIITRTLLKYLSDERVLCNIKDTLAKGVWKPSEDPLCDLVEYAVQYWHEHYQETLQDPQAESHAEEVFQLLENMSLTQILWELNTHLRRDSLPAAFGIRDPLCLAARVGLTGFIRKFQVPTNIREDKSLEATVTQPPSDTAGNLRITTDKYLYIEIACWEGHLDIVKLLVGHDQVKKPQDLTKPLKCASLRGHNIVIQYLVDKIRTSRGSFDWDHELVLRAAEIGYESQVVLFVDSGATPDAEYGGITPLQLATRNGHSSIVEFLLSKGADPSSAHAEDLNKPIHYAVEQGHFSVLDQLLKADAKVTIRNGQGRTPLHLASQRGDVNILKRLLGHFDLTPVSHSHSGRAAFHYRRMAFLDAADNLGNSSLHLASANGHTAVVEFLLGQGAKLDLANTEGVTALWTSVKHRHELTAASIVSNANSTTEFSDIGKVIFEAARLGYVAVVRLALQKGFLAAEDLKSSDQLGCTALHYAAQNGRGAILKFLIEQDLDIGQRNNEHDTPLILAACAGKPDVVRTLLSLLRLDRDAYVDQNSDITTLVVRIAKMDGISTSLGHADVVKTLLLENADPNGVDSFSRTALHYAAQHGNLIITQALLQFGADSALKDREGRNSLHFAAFNGWTAIARLLLTTEVDPLEADLEGRTPMHLAAMKDAPDILDLLWRTKPELLELEAFNNQTPLHAASDKATCTKWLLQHEANINAQDSNGQTPLILAVEHGDSDVVEQLLGKNAKVTLKDTKQWTALHYAAFHGQWTTGQKILDQDIAVINFADQTKRSALHIAIIENRDKFAYGLLGERFGPKLELDLQDSNGDSPLILAVRRSSEQILEALLRLGANTELRNKRGETVLVAAVRERKQDIIKILLEPSRNNKAKINGGGGKAEPTALYAATTTGRRDIVDLLLGFDADVNSPGGMCNTPLVAAAKGGWVSLVKLFLSRGVAVSQGGGIYANALCAAIDSGTLDLVDDLIKSASDINQPDEQGRTSMHWAAWRGSWILLEHLMGKGGNPFVRDLQQRTLIHHAVMGGDVDMIKKLLSDEKTKELYLKDIHGWTPLHWACRLEHNRSMVKSLVQHLDDHQKSELAEPILHHWTPEIIAIFHDNMNILELIPKIWTKEQSERDWAVGSPHSGFACDGCQLKVSNISSWRTTTNVQITT